jgi:4-amino-4-deoxy-L-arabinose transferase-like glycosyltransferase
MNRRASETPSFRRWWIALCFAAAAAACLWRVGAPPLLETDEGFTANRSASMLRHGTWLLTYDDIDEYGPQFRKPPLIYWTIAALMRAIGRNLWAVRLPIALSGLAVCWLLYALHRPYLGPPAAAAAAALPLSVPFYLHHVRTAMLDLPLICFILAAALCFSRAKNRGLAIVGFALAAGAALLTKKAGAVLAPVSALGLAWIEGRRGWRVLVEIAAACALALVPLALYFAACPDMYRQGLSEAFFTRQVAGNVPEHMRAHAIPIVLSELFQNLRWHVVAAAMGAALIVLRGSYSQRKWLLVALLFIVPVILGTSREAVLYARYTLLAYPFLVAAGLVGCLEVAALPGRGPLWALLSFAGLCAVTDSTTWTWLPLSAALLVLVALAVRHSTVRPALAGTLLALSVAGATWASPASLNLIDHFARHDMTLPSELAREARSLTQPGDTLVVHGSGYKFHNILWHSDRPLQALTSWAARDLRPGEVKYGITRGSPPEGLRGIQVNTISRRGEFRLVRIDVAPDCPYRHGFLLASAHRHAGLMESLRLLGVPFEEEKPGLMILDIPPHAQSTSVISRLRWSVKPEGLPLTPDGPLLVGRSAIYTGEFAEPENFCGLDLVTRKDHPRIAGLIVEARPAETDVWTNLWTIAIHPNFRVQPMGDRIEANAIPALRLRCEPRRVDAIRFDTTRWSTQIGLREIRVLRSSSSSSSSSNR